GASAELYDPVAGSFSSTGSMSTTRALAAAILLSTGKVLISGGSGAANLASAELYDPLTGTFSATGSMTTGRFFHTMTLLPSGKVLITGGSQPTGPSCCIFLASAELYDPTAGTFALTGSMSTVRSGHTATLLANGRALIGAGKDNSGL